MKTKDEDILFASPKIPQKDYSLDPDQIQKYLQALCPETKQGNQDYQEMKSILDHTRYVDFKTFLKVASKTFESLATELGNDLWTFGYQDIYSLQGKSNLWMIQLLFELEPSLKKTFRLLGNHDKIHNFVFLDDAIYSGTQTAGHVTELTLQLGSSRFSGQGFNVYIVAVFSTSRLQNILRTPDNVTLHFIIGEQISTYDSMLQNEAYEEFQKKKIHDQDKKFTRPNTRLTYFSNQAVPIYFAHKLPDSMSSFPKLYSGFIPRWNSKTVSLQDQQACPSRLTDQWIPLIRNCTEKPNRMACPPPPYK